MSANDANSEKIVVSKGENGVARVHLNRPDKLNALDDEMYSALRVAFDSLSADRSVRAIILSGEGRGFCAGSDVGRMLETDLVDGRSKLGRRHSVIRALYAVEKPVIASIRGPCAGIGVSLVMACDLVVASDSTYFVQSFRDVGLVPDGGGIYLLSQRLGIGRAKELVFTGRRLPAREAYDWGIVQKVVTDGDLEKASIDFASELACGPTLALALSKKLFQTAAHTSLDIALEIESFAAGVARVSNDHTEGVTAFREKRVPKFKGE